jgi:pSer/pThr/pTyr-binding forkhead associated (FHA) protein
MTDQVLNILKFVLLGLLYLFFARVLWAVWSEVRTPTRRPTVGNPRTAATRPADQATVPTPRPAPTPVPAPAAGRQQTKQDKKSSKQSAKQAAKQAKGSATRLVVLEPKSRRGISVGLGEDVTLGREPGCTITIDDDAYVSQLHLRVYVNDGRPMVEDLGSTNGTFHNGSKITSPRLLHPGDRIQVGTTVIEAQ